MHYAVWPWHENQGDAEVEGHAADAPALHTHDIIMFGVKTQHPRDSGFCNMGNEFRQKLAWWSTCAPSGQILYGTCTVAAAVHDMTALPSSFLAASTICTGLGMMERKSPVQFVLAADV